MTGSNFHAAQPASTARLVHVVGAGSSPRPALCPFNSAGLTSALSRSGTLRPASATSASTTTARSRTQTKSYCPGNQQTTRDKLWREASLITFTQRRNAVSVVITSGMGRELRDILVGFVTVVILQRCVTGCVEAESISPCQPVGSSRDIIRQNGTSLFLSPLKHNIKKLVHVFH